MYGKSSEPTQKKIKEIYNTELWDGLCFSKTLTKIQICCRGSARNFIHSNFNSVGRFSSIWNNYKILKFNMQPLVTMRTYNKRLMCLQNEVLLCWFMTDRLSYQIFYGRGWGWVYSTLYALRPVHCQWTDASLCVSGISEKSSLRSLTTQFFLPFNKTLY